MYHTTVCDMHTLGHLAYSFYCISMQSDTSTNQWSWGKPRIQLGVQVIYSGLEKGKVEIGQSKIRLLWMVVERIIMSLDGTE